MRRTMLIAVVVVALVFGLVAYAGAASAPTAISANVSTIIELTAPATANLGALTPDVPANVSVALHARSNKDATLSSAVTGSTFTSLVSGLETPMANVRGGNINLNDTVTGMVDFSVDGGSSVSGLVTYTLVQ